MHKYKRLYVWLLFKFVDNCVVLVYVQVRKSYSGIDGKKIMFDEHAGIPWVKWIRMNEDPIFLDLQLF